MVFVNNYMRRAFLGSPFGGVKGSGVGRENAVETLHEFVRSKNVRPRPDPGVATQGFDQPGRAVMSRSDPVNSGCLRSAP